MRYKSARAATPVAIEPDHIPLGAPLNGGAPHHRHDQEVILQRTGLRPLRFTGALIASNDCSFAPYRARIRLALYRIAQHDFVAAWQCTFPSQAEQSLSCHSADRFTTLHAAITAFELAEPDFPCEALPASIGISAILQHLTDGVAREMAVRAAFGRAVGMFLYDLCMAGVTSFGDV